MWTIYEADKFFLGMISGENSCTAVLGGNGVPGPRERSFG